MIQVINTTTGEVLYESEEKVHVAIRVDDKERFRVSANTEAIAIYLRDPTQDRAQIDLGRSGMGLWARMIV